MGLSGPEQLSGHRGTPAALGGGALESKDSPPGAEGISQIRMTECLGPAAGGAMLRVSGAPQLAV